MFEGLFGFVDKDTEKKCAAIGKTGKKHKNKQSGSQTGWLAVSQSGRD